MKKICHLTSAHNRFDIRIFEKECVSLVKCGYDVSLVVADGLPDQIIKGVKIFGVPKEKGKRGRFLKANKNVFKKGLEIGADIYHFHDPEMLWYGNKLKKRNKTVIFDAHEDLPRQIQGRAYIPKSASGFVSFVLERFEDYCCRKYDAIITATPFINQRFLKVNKTSVNINNYPFLDEFKSENEIIEVKQTNNICYIGGVSKIRGLDYVIKALSETKSTLQLAGNIRPDSYKEELKSFSGWEKVNYHGNVSRKKVKEILNDSIAGVVTFLPYPNHINSQPNKLFEYMSSGIPVIASNYPLWKGIIEKYDSGICVDPENSAKISEAINFLIENPVEAQRKGANGRKAIEDIFNWEAEEKKLVEVYRNLVT